MDSSLFKHNEIQHKINALGLKEVDYRLYWKHLATLESMGKDTSDFIFYKQFGNETMFYSKTYIRNNDLDELLKRDNETKQRLQPNVFRRIYNKYNSFMFKRYLKKKIRQGDYGNYK